MDPNNGKTPPEDIGDDCAEHDDGVDESLIEWMLSLTPRQRLQILQQNVNSTLKSGDPKRQRIFKRPSQLLIDRKKKSNPK